MIMVATATDALAPPADEEETAEAQTADDDYEAHDGHGDDNAQVYAGSRGCGSGEGHARGEEGLGEDA